MQPRDFNLTPSKIYLTLLSVVFFLSWVVIIYLPLNIFWQLGLIFLASYYAWSLYIQYARLRHANSILAISYLGDNLWQVQTPSGISDVTLHGESTVTQYVSILCFRVQATQKIISTVIFPDALSADEYRKLLVTLRMF